MNALKKILVVDDDPVIGRSFDRVLSPKGYAVICAADGSEALDRLASEHYDVVYTDIRMPGLDGLEVARRIRASRPWLPVVIVTGFGSDAAEAKARELGVAEFLRKPLSPEMIEASVARPLATPAAAEAGSATEVPAAPKRSVAKDIGLFIAAPFIGLGYALALPFVGLAMLGWIGYEAMKARETRKARH